MRRLALLLLLTPAWAPAAEYSVSDSDSVVDGDTFCAGPCLDGDVLTYTGDKTRTGVLVLQDIDASLADPVIFRNDPTEDGPLVILSSPSGSPFIAGFEIRRSLGLHIKGDDKWVGAPGGKCGIDDDGTEGRTQCGIIIRRNGTATPNSYIRRQEFANEITISGVHIDGVNQTSGIGIGIAPNDRNYDCDGGGKESGDCNETQHDWYMRNNYIKETAHEGIYIGINYENSGSAGNPPTEDIFIQRNLFEDTGWTCAQIKGLLYGIADISYNTCYRGGTQAAQANDDGHSLGLQCQGCRYARIYGNKVFNAGGTGIAMRSLRMPSSVATNPTCDIFNNLIVDSGQILTKNGINLLKRDPSNMNQSCDISYNTIVGSSDHAINVGGNGITGVNIRDNILCDSSGAEISGSATETNNWEQENSCNGAGFIDYSGRNFNLSGLSVNRDAGSTTAPADDIRGVSRDASPDRGAYEYSTGGGEPPPTFECNDTIDNDGDDAIDYPDDPGCGSPTDNDESDDPIPPGSGDVQGKPSSYTADTAETFFFDHCYMFDEGTGGTAADYCASELGTTEWPLTITGADWDSDSFQGAHLNFVKANSDFAENNAISLSGTSIMCMVAKSGASDNLTEFFASATDKDGTDWIFTMQSTPGGYQSVGTGFGVTWEANNGPTFIEDAEWFWMCGRFSDVDYDGSVNGVEWDERAHTNTGSVAAVDTLSVGRVGDSTPSNYVDFEIAFLGIKVNTNWTSANLATIWNSGNIWPLIGIDADAGGGGSPPDSAQNQGDYSNAAP